jgi:two-component system sensor histidine kinase KdpD
MRRGQLRIYLGAAPGVGKTYAMLNEGRRRAARGTDVVVGYVETHARARTREQVGDLDVVARKPLEYRGSTFEEMDVDTVLARHPQVALVDELAHTNVPGSRNAKRWQDIEELLAAGIDVISTVNIQHLESMNDVVEEITGIKQQETVPDAFVRGADQVELVDATPEALRRRMAHGNIYPSERIDAALTNYFRPGNLGALRELALMWLADKVDDALQTYREQHGIAKPWETRERVVVALTGAPHGADLIRRAARIAARSHGELVGVHVRSADGLASGSSDALLEQRKILDDLGGTYHEVAGADVARALTQFAQTHNATQVVLGSSRRSRWAELVTGSVINDVIRRSGPIDVHVISTEEVEGEARRRPSGTSWWRRAWLMNFSRRRVALGWVTAIVAPIVMTIVLTRLRDHVALSTDLLLYLLLVVASAAIGGIAPAAFAAVESFLLANWYFTPPIHQWTVAEPQNLFALFVFVAVAITVGWFVAEAARRTAEAARARSEAETLAALAAIVGSDDDPLSAIVEQVRAAFSATAVSVLRDRDGQWRTEAAAGAHAPSTPDDADFSLPLEPGVVLALRGSGRDSIDVPTLRAFASQLGVALERRRMRAEAATAARVAEVSDLRAALLAAVSHDLRTPLASIKASVSTLRQEDIEWSDDDRAELLETIEVSADRLTDLVTNLLGMSRIHAGTVELATRPVELEEVVSRAVAGIDERDHEIVIDIDAARPVIADAALLERAVANVVDNALKWSPPGCDVVVRADAHGDHVVLFVVDHGPGIPVADRERVFEPFQRADDRPTVVGTGLGLAVARGFVELMGGQIQIEDTPGGGTTVVLTLPGAP